VLEPRNELTISEEIKSSMVTKPPDQPVHRLLIGLVVILVILSVQGWLGDFVNLFITTFRPQLLRRFSLSGFFQTVGNLNSFPLFWHAYEGAVLLALAIALTVLSFKWSKKPSVRICAILGLFSLFASALGGFLFVLSGFSNGGNSAQMGGSFIGAYALYFMELCFTK
jgi:hypothetical protein